jgi:hypothetical protein
MVIEPLKINEMGFAYANPEAYIPAVAKEDIPVNRQVLGLRKKEFVGKNPSEDTYSAATTGNLTAIQFNGETLTLESPVLISAGTVTEVQEAIEKLIEKYEGNLYVRVTYDSGTVTIRHVGDLRLSQIAISDVASGALQSTSQLSNLVTVGDFTLNGVFGQLGPIQYGESSQSLGNDPYNWTGTPATDNATASTLATDLGTAFTALGIVVIGSISVSANVATSAYDISFKARIGENGIYFTGSGAMKLMEESNFEQIFVA